MNSGKFIADQQSCMAVETAMHSEWIINTMPLLFVLSAFTCLAFFANPITVSFSLFMCSWKSQALVSLLCVLCLHLQSKSLMINYSQPHNLRTISKTKMLRSVSLSSRIVDNINVQVINCG